MNELKGKVDQLLRDWGNRSGRARMRADLQLRQTFAPRGLIIGTVGHTERGFARTSAHLHRSDAGEGRASLGEAQQDVAQKEKPVALYLTALRQLLRQGTLYLRSREYPDLVDREYPKLSVRVANAEFVGWYDDQYIYLLSKVALRVCCESAIFFLLTQNPLPENT